MADQKVTLMVLNVDLQCSCCYKKVKKILCKFPQIRDQQYNVKANKVTITVVCCNPEKIRDKLCCKGKGVIKSIEIIEPPKPKPPEKPKEPEKPKPPPEKPKEPEKPKPPPEKPPEKPKPPPQKPPEKPKEPPPPPKPEPPKPPPPAPAPCPAPPPPCPVPAFPVRTCCGPCYEGYGGGPCYHGYGGPPPPPRQPCYCGCGGYGGCGHVSRCDYYFSEENPQSCSIM